MEGVGRASRDDRKREGLGIMNKQKVRDRIAEIGVITGGACVVIDAKALIVAEAVCRGGIPIVEITMTVPERSK